MEILIVGFEERQFYWQIITHVELNENEEQNKFICNRRCNLYDSYS